MPLALFFVLRIALAIWGLLWLYTNFIIVFYYFCEKCHWNCDRDCIESMDGFGRYGHSNNINSSQWEKDSLFNK